MHFKGFERIKVADEARVSSVLNEYLIVNLKLLSFMSTYNLLRKGILSLEL